MAATYYLDSNPTLCWWKVFILTHKEKVLFDRDTKIDSRWKRRQQLYIFYPLDPKIMKKSGRILIVAELAKEYGFKDVGGMFLYLVSSSGDWVWPSHDSYFGETRTFQTTSCLALPSAEVSSLPYCVTLPITEKKRHGAADGYCKWLSILRLDGLINIFMAVR